MVSVYETRFWCAAVVKKSNNVRMTMEYYIVGGGNARGKIVIG